MFVYQLGYEIDTLMYTVCAIHAGEIMAQQKFFFFPDSCVFIPHQAAILIQANLFTSVGVLSL